MVETLFVISVHKNKTDKLVTEFSIGKSRYYVALVDTDKTLLKASDQLPFRDPVNGRQWTVADLLKRLEPDR
jgi:hypothetical protein